MILLDPEDVEAHYKLGGVHYHQGNLKGARREYESSVKLNPRSAVFHYDLGRVYKDLGREEDANRQFEEALRISPSLDDGLEWIESLKK